MGNMIVKIVQEPSDDRWAVWSTNVDNFTFFGTREEVTRTLLERAGIAVATPQFLAPLNVRFERAAERGCSSYLSDWWFTEEGERLHNVEGWDAEFDEDHVPFLPRTALPDLYERYHPWYLLPEDDPEPEPTYLDLLIAQEVEG